MFKRSITRRATRPAAKSKRRGDRAAAGLIALLAALALTSVGAGPASAGPAHGKFTCKATGEFGAFAPVAAGSNTYIIGNCAPGTVLRRTYYSVDQGGPYNGGRIYGHFRGCGAVQIRNLRRVNSTDRISICTNAGKRPPSEFLSVVDCRAHGRKCRNKKSGWDRGLGGDKTTQVVATCQAYANYRPFSKTPKATDPVQVIDPATRRPNRSGARVRWRYVTKDGKFVMVHDYAWRTSPRGTPWVFVAAGCVTTPHATTP